MDIAPANGNRPWERALCPLCPSCTQAREMCTHILWCNDEGRVDTLMKSVDLLASWMMEANTDPNLRECIVDYAKGRGTVSMSELCHDKDTRFRQMAANQDKIGWRRFMEGMVASGLREIQTDFSRTEGSRMSPTQ